MPAFPACYGISASFTQPVSHSDFVAVQTSNFVTGCISQSGFADRCRFADVLGVEHRPDGDADVLVFGNGREPVIRPFVVAKTLSGLGGSRRSVGISFWICPFQQGHHEARVTRHFCRRSQI